MIQKEKITELVESYLKDTSLFLVEVKVSSRNQITVFLDGDEGVPISSCIELSRHIESQLDRDTEDFDLEVSSVGISRPLSLSRQFISNIGREIAFDDSQDRKIKGKLIAADHTGFSIEKELPKKKKKKPVEESEEPIQSFNYKDVNDVKVQVSFKNKI